MYLAALHHRASPPTAFICSPPPPRFLWDTDDPQFLEKVKCHAIIRITGIDIKTGMFTLRMKCHWAFRTSNLQQETEANLRGVPGIRMPALMVDVEESRVWKDIKASDPVNATKTTQRTLYWKGTSIFTLRGYKMFHMENFCFDRQLINLELFHFVWRPDKDAEDYYKSMHVASFTADTSSMLAEWRIEPTYIIPLAKSVIVPEKESDPTAASQFLVKLRLEHEHLFYIWQVCFPATLMTLVSITPLAMPPAQDDMGDRLSVYTGGLLTLVAFKYGVTDHLPSVPYPTYIDTYLRWQVIGVSLCAFESVVSFHLVLQGSNEIHEDSPTFVNLDNLENLLMALMCIFWCQKFLHARFRMPSFKPDWRDVWAQKKQHRQDVQRFELQDEEISSLSNTQLPICKGMLLAATRDNLAVWHPATGQCMKTLKVREAVEALGSVVSSDEYGRRFNPYDDELISKDEARAKFFRQPNSRERMYRFWETECQARLVVPVNVNLPSEQELNELQPKIISPQMEDDYPELIVEVAYLRAGVTRRGMSPQQLQRSISSVGPRPSKNMSQTSTVCWIL